jgi:hypothetical protein
MKLSDLINFRNQLNSIPRDAVKKSADAEIEVLMHMVGEQGEYAKSYIDDFEKRHSDLNQSFECLFKDVDRLKQYINKSIEKEEKHWFQESYKLFEIGMSLESNEVILNRRLSLTGENTKHATYQSETILRARLTNYADWRFPGLIIRPGLENFIEHMVSYDPLYIVDQNYDLLKPCLSQYPEQYQNRLRTYTMNDRTDDLILGKIPNNQFGMCLVYNFFNYRPLEIIRRYLQEIFQKLRPGGLLLMTYNDCDQANAVRLVETFFACYTPGYLIRDLAKSIGFEQVHTWGDGGPSVWLELKKPGKLESLRGGQTLAKVNDANGIDISAEKVYTNEQFHRLRAQVASLGVPPNQIDTMTIRSMLDTVIDLTAKKKIKEDAEAKAKAEEELAIKKDRELKEELHRLRSRALELNVANPNLVRYGYSIEKLRNLVAVAEAEAKLTGRKD